MSRLGVLVAFAVAAVAAVGTGWCAYLLDSPDWAPWLVLVGSFPFYAVGLLIVVDAIDGEQPSAEGYDDGSGERPVWTADDMRSRLSPHSAWQSGQGVDDLDATREVDLRIVPSHRAPRQRKAGIR